MEQQNCDFCGKAKEDVALLIAGPKVFICDGCIDIAKEVIDEERKERAKAI